MTEWNAEIRGTGGGRWTARAWRPDLSRPDLLHHPEGREVRTCPTVHTSPEAAMACARRVAELPEWLVGAQQSILVCPYSSVGGPQSSVDLDLVPGEGPEP